MKPTLIVLAAGMGSRYGGLKQLDRLGVSGETLMDYALYDAARSGFGKVVFVIRRDFEQAFREKVLAPLQLNIEVCYVFQETEIKLNDEIIQRKKPWGTGHALLAAKNEVAGTFAVINADDFYGQEAFSTLVNYLTHLPQNSSEYALVGYVLQNTLSDNGTVSRGVCQVNEVGYLTNIVERKKIWKDAQGIFCFDETGKQVELDGNSLVSMNLWGGSKGVFDVLEAKFPAFVQAHKNDPKAEFLIPEAFGEMIANGSAQVKVLRSNARWIGVTYKDDKPEAMQKLKALTDQGVYPTNLWN
ncbi:NTP transferase domain-containing protein [uncultured Microscilla sp.]|uniref:nucleotidyltransferase family protein n=1 Tax=uncultured Microscilla sp. TaxID=432653 RepID=UPI0026120CBB|nr:NTP transferase domain-containing protein [uncultured Microscilla sp.]